jgi:hypothetical protein
VVYQPVRVLPIWVKGGVTPDQLAVIKRAKLALNLPFKVRPVKAIVTGVEPVLALGSPPPFPIDYVLSVKRGDIQAVLLKVLTGEGDPPILGRREFLARHLGCEVGQVKEVTDTEV